MKSLSKQPRQPICDNRNSEFGKPDLRRRGLSLLEVTVSTLLVGLVTVGAMRSLGTSVRASNSTAQTTQAVLMAEELMVEILARNYSDPTETVVFGLESSEDKSSREQWDDVDDYSGWSASPPVDAMGESIASDIWTRTVSVVHVDPNDLQTELSAYDDRGVKAIIVRVFRDQEQLAELHGLQTEAWISMIPEPGNNSTTGQTPPVNQSPVAAFMPNHTVGSGFLTVTFDGSGSTDPEDQPLEYEWDLGDGSSKSGEVVEHTFVNDQDTVQVFEITLTVSDVHGSENKTVAAITVFPAPDDGFLEL